MPITWQLRHYRSFSHTQGILSTSGSPRHCPRMMASKRPCVVIRHSSPNTRRPRAAATVCRGGTEYPRGNHSRRSRSIMSSQRSNAGCPLRKSRRKAATKDVFFERLSESMSSNCEKPEIWPIRWIPREWPTRSASRNPACGASRPPCRRAIVGI